MINEYDYCGDEQEHWRVPYINLVKFNFVLYRKFFGGLRVRKA